MTSQLTWLVTGCSSGLGEALVHAILAKGDKVIATARARGPSGTQRLAALEAAGAAVLELDITAGQAALDAKAKEAWEVYGHVDVLVNNAGFADIGVFEEISEDILLKSLRTNAIGPLNLVRAFLPYMRQRGKGSLLFVSSLSVFMGMPGANCYSGSKGLLEGIVPNLAMEIAPFGLRTCLVTPGYFRTSLMTAGNYVSTTERSLPAYEIMNGHIREGCAAEDGNQQGDPKKAAAIVVDAVRGEGRCEGKMLPARLIVGQDAFEGIKASCASTIEVCDEWKGIVGETDIDPKK